MSKSLIEDYEAPSEHYGVNQAIDVNDTNYQVNTKNYWRERALVLEKLLGSVAPVEPQKDARIERSISPGQ